MSAKLDNLEIVHEGWLTKSPPTTRIWRARWRKRWFILRHSGELPGQYFLCYYTDRNCRKLKGQIDLDQCEQVDAGLRFENRKQKYQFMFNIRTPKRMYYLAAETEDDMNKWVDCICHVCGLKPFIMEDTTTEYEGDNISQATTGITNLTESSPPITPRTTTTTTTIITGPYIPISECISGKPINSPDEFKQFLLTQCKPKLNERESYDMPRKLKPPEVSIEGCTPPPSPDSESVFTDDESIHRSTTTTRRSRKPNVNWDTFPRQSESSLEDESIKSSTTTNDGTMINSSTTVKINRRFTRAPASADNNNTNNVVAPPRPPKPAHFILNDTTTTTSATNSVVNTVMDTTSSEAVAISPTMAADNCQTVTTPSSAKESSSVNKIEVIGNDEMYDIPRSHQLMNESSNGCNNNNNDSKLKQTNNRHCYTNAAPSGNIFRYDFTLPVVNTSEDAHSAAAPPPESPRSETSSVTSTTIVYSNLPSPSNNSASIVIPTPPAVNRELKPGRKYSDSTGGSNEPSPSLPIGPPNIDRKLKPAQLKKIQETRNEENSGLGTLKLSSPPAGSLGRRKQRTGPHPSTPTIYNSPNKVVCSPYDNFTFNTNSRVHKKHSTSDDKLTPAKDEVHFYQLDNHTFHTRNRHFGSSKRFDEIQYLDLDLDSSTDCAAANITSNVYSESGNSSFPLSGAIGGLVKKSSENLPTPSTATVYKTVDFLKTDAFNRTRIDIEEERSRLCLAADTSS